MYVLNVIEMKMLTGILITEITLDMSPVRVPNLRTRIAYGINNQFPGFERSKHRPIPTEIVCLTVLFKPHFDACRVSPGNNRKQHKKS